MEYGKISSIELYDMICKAKLPNVQSFDARDGSQLSFRHYPAESNKVVILLHGGTEGQVNCPILFTYEERSI